MKKIAWQDPGQAGVGTTDNSQARAGKNFTIQCSKSFHRLGRWPYKSVSLGKINSQVEWKRVQRFTK